MQTSYTQGGINLSWGATHRDKDGNLICRMASIETPPFPKCIKINCLVKYLFECLTAALVASYHARRVAYAEKNRRKKILERYRTGEPSPKTLWAAIHANIKLQCPICRKFNADPLLFNRTTT